MVRWVKQVVKEPDVRSGRGIAFCGFELLGVRLGARSGREQGCVGLLVILSPVKRPHLRPPFVQSQFGNRCDQNSVGDTSPCAMVSPSHSTSSTYFARWEDGVF